MKLLDLMEGARNFIVEFCKVKKGEEVLMVTSPSVQVDQLVIEALTLAIKEAGGIPYIMEIETMSLDELYEAASKLRLLANSMCMADIVVDLGAQVSLLMHTRVGARAMYEYETLFVGCLARTAELMSSEWARFPTELNFAIAREVFRRTREGKKFSVTDPEGTDLEGEIHPTHITGYILNEYGEPAPGYRSNHAEWPGGTCGFHPEGDVNGVIVTNYAAHVGPKLPEPMKITVENHRVTKVEGGGKAGKDFKRYFEKIENANWVAEVMYGFHPKAPKWVRPGVIGFSFTRHAGTLHIGFGNSRALGGPVVSKIHEDVVIPQPTLYINGKKLIDDGKLLVLEDPKIREVASKYGDPDTLLEEVE